jgi:hypothetical protein
VGLVRAERVIKGAHASRTFYCGGCHYSWIVDDDEQAPDAKSAVPPDAKAAVPPDAKVAVPPDGSV